MVKTPRVYLILRKNGDDRPRVQVECDLYSMNTYVDMLRHLYDDPNCDYLIVEPVPGDFQNNCF